MKTLKNTDHTENSANVGNKESNSEIINRAYLINYLFTHNEAISEPINTTEIDNTDSETRNFVIKQNSETTIIHSL